MNNHREQIWNGRTVLQLTSPNLSVLIDMNDGMNVVSICYKGREQIDYNKERYEKGGTYGIPILYPTPNRVKNNTFTFEGTRCNCPMHGLVRKTPFTEVACTADENSASITGEICFEENQPLYEQFPFKSRLHVQITATTDSVIWAYTVFNDDKKTLPYGFALHPFFVRNNHVLIQTNADHIMNANTEKFPDGSLTAVAATSFDLSLLTPINSLNMDTVYYKCNASKKPLFAKINYLQEKLLLLIESSTESNHLVIFIPPQSAFFCIEPQTCSTDCHNLYAHGFKTESNLLLVPPGTSQQGWSKITFRQQA